MAKRPKQGTPAIAEILEVHGFDLMAQIEAMLRHVRQYQREVQRFRGLMGKGETNTKDQAPLEAVRTHIERLRNASTEFADTLDSITSAADRADGSRRSLARRRPT